MATGFQRDNMSSNPALELDRTRDSIRKTAETNIKNDKNETVGYADVRQKAITELRTGNRSALSSAMRFRPAFGKHAGQNIESIVHQYELGDGSACAGSGTHADAHVGILEGEDVVDPIAGHRHLAAPGLKGLHHLALLPRGHPTEDRIVLDHVADSFPVFEGKRSGIDGVIRCADDSGTTRNGGDRERIVPRHDLEPNSLRCEIF